MDRANSNNVISAYFDPPTYGIFGIINTDDFVNRVVIFVFECLVYINFHSSFGTFILSTPFLVWAQILAFPSLTSTHSCPFSLVLVAYMYPYHW